MESFETSFIRKHNDIVIQNNQDGIKTADFVDYMKKSYEMDPNDIIIPPGIIITQENQIVSGRLANGSILFNYRAPHKLHGFIFDSEKLFALDGIQNVHIYSPNATSPELRDIGRRPLGWRVIPKTKTIVYWTLISMHAHDIETDKTTNLRQHRSKVTCADVTMSTVVSGDANGYISIWYVSSWKCHHHILTGGNACKDICIDSESHVSIITDRKCIGYCMMTGVMSFSVDMVATYLSKIDYGLVLSDGHHIALLLNGKCKLCFKNAHKKIVTGPKNTIYTLTNKKVVEMSIENIDWPTECIEWIRNPCLPLEKNWPSRRYMDVLAIIADIWVPEILNWTPPKQWFRHEKLRNAIWEVAIANNMDISHTWNFLTPHIMRKWHTKNINAVLKCMETDDIKAIDILTRIYKTVDIKNEIIQRWCWARHDKRSLTPIISTMMAKDSTFLDIAMQHPITPDAIMSFNGDSVRMGLQCGHVAFFIRCLEKYHQEYCTPPSHHMQNIFELILQHVYTHLKSTNMDTPLVESGSWATLSRPAPNNLGAYIRCGRTTGIITEIQFQPNTVIRWKPINRTLESIISSSESVEIWKYKYKTGPNTMLECALKLLSNDIWTAGHRIQKFKWFKSEIGAFLSETMAIRVFDSPMRIIRADAGEGAATITTSTNLHILESEQAEIHSVVPLWSYYDQKMIHIIPLRLKICNVIVKNSRKNIVSTKYAAELLDAVRFKTIEKEHSWRTSDRVTTIASDLDLFIMGFSSGDICEYNSIGDTIPIRHFIRHTNSIKNIHIFDSKMLSLCEDEFIIWNIDTATIVFSKNTCMTYVGTIPGELLSIWVIERWEEQFIISLWDILDEQIVKRKTISEKGPLITTNSSEIILGNRVINMYGTEYIINTLRGQVTCAASIQYGICGGTSRGVVFMIDKPTMEMREWTCTTHDPITAIYGMEEEPYVISGSESGVITIWSVENLDVIGIIKLSHLPINHIYSENMFVIVAQHTTLHLLTVIQDRCALAINTIQKIMSWSNKWKTRLIQNTDELLRPSITTCILNKTGVQDAIHLLEDCTKEYEHRIPWCVPEFIDILLEGPPQLTKLAVKRLASFRGPRLDCVICNDSSRTDKICFIKTCQHRFHTGCIAELIRKVPEHHDDMQYEYALSVRLKCPICRTPFNSEDVQEDVFLSRFHTNE